MKEGFLSYWYSLWTDIPLWFYEAGASILCIVVVLSISIWGFLRCSKYGLAVLLVEYVLLIYGSTVFFRTASKTVAYNLMPFWSYQAYLDGREPNALIENFMNVVVFVPVGVMLGCMMNGTLLKSRKGWKIALLVGIGLSIGIEVLQFVFKKGFSEIDDVIHNTIGCLLGYVIWLIVLEIWNFSTNWCRLHWGRGKS